MIHVLAFLYGLSSVALAAERFEAVILLPSGVLAERPVALRFDDLLANLMARLRCDTFGLEWFSWT